jgi:SAM-dependent methyltransferase
MKPQWLTRAFLDERFVPELEYETVQGFDHLRRYLLAQQYVRGKYVIDVACGTGYGSAMLLRAGASQVISIDINSAALQYAKKHWGTLRFIVGDAVRLPLPKHCADIVVSFETLEHLTHPEDFLAEVKRVLKLDGRLLLSTPNRLVASPGSSIPHSPYHAFEPTLSELQSLLSSQGWTIEQSWGMSHSERVHTRSATGPHDKQEHTIAWSAYARHLAISLIPPALYSRLRKSQPLDISDSIISEGAGEASSFFVVLCRQA